MTLEQRQRRGESWEALWGHEGGGAGLTGPGASCRFWLLLCVSEKPAQGWSDVGCWDGAMVGLMASREREGRGKVGRGQSRDDDKGWGWGRTTNKWLHSRLLPQGGPRILCDRLDVGYVKASLMDQVVKNPLAMQEPQQTWVLSLGQDDPLE